MDQGIQQGIGTILAMLAFLSVCWWAFSKHKKKDFDEASQLPFVGDEPKEEQSEEQSGDSSENEQKRQN